MGARAIGLGLSGTVYALVASDDLSLLLVALDGAFSEHGFQARATYDVHASRGAVRHYLELQHPGCVRRGVIGLISVIKKPGVFRIRCLKSRYLSLITRLLSQKDINHVLGLFKKRLLASCV